MNLLPFFEGDLNAHVSRKKLVTTASRCNQAGKQSVTFCRKQERRRAWADDFFHKSRREQYKVRDNVVGVVLQNFLKKAVKSMVYR